METRFFMNYGRLEWLEPEDYFKGDWMYVVSSEPEDDEDTEYDIVRSRDNTEYRYTTI